MPIPLLRLPLLVLDEVIKNLSLRQLFLLSLCSKRMNSAVKNIREKSTKLTMRLTVGRDITIELMDKKKWIDLLHFNVQAVPKDRQGWRAEKFGTILLHWEDVEGGTRYILEYMSDLFCAPINNVRLQDIRYLWMLDWIEKRQGPRSYEASVNDPRNGLTDEQFRHLLVDLKPTNLRLQTISEIFRVLNCHESFQEIKWSNGNWLTIENLLTIDCNRLTVEKPTFTVTEMNRFFRHVLIDGVAPRLTKFVAGVNNGDHNRILDGVREVLTPIHGGEQFEENRRKEWKFSGEWKRGNRSATVSIKCFHKVQQCFVWLEITGS